MSPIWSSPPDFTCRNLHGFARFPCCRSLLWLMIWEQTVKYTNLLTLPPCQNSYFHQILLPCNMTDYLSSLLTWTADNDMQLNTSKTKEMILGRIDSTSIPWPYPSLPSQLQQSSWPNPTRHDLQVTWPSSRCQFILVDSHQYHSI